MQGNPDFANWVEFNALDSAETFSNFKVDSFILLDTNNDIFYAENVTLEEGEYVLSGSNANSLSAEIVSYLRANDDLLLAANVDGFSGIIILDDAPIMVGVTSIRPSLWEAGQPVGTLIAVSRLDDQQIADIADQTNFDVKVHRLNADLSTELAMAAEQVLQQPRRSPNRFYSMPIEDGCERPEGCIAAYSLLYDLDDEPVLLLEVTIPREINAQAQQTLGLFTLLLFLLGFGFVALTLIILDFLILRRVTTIGQEISEIGDSQDHSRRLTVNGSDELTKLEETVNQMLEKLEQMVKREKLLLEDRSAHLEQQVTERTQELKATNELLERANNAKDEFLGAVSHELMTPITNLVLYHHLVDRTPEKVGDYVPVLKRETQRLKRIVNDLLRFSEASNQQVEVEATEVDLSELAKECVSEDQILASHERLTLAFEPAKEPILAMVDASQVKQSVFILIENALNYTPLGGNIYVSTRSKQEDTQTWVGINVTDTGLGIQEQEIPHIFERFYRGKASLEASIPGTGMGLAFARDLTERQNGHIEVESEGVAGKGSSFTLWFPCIDQLPE